MEQEKKSVENENVNEVEVNNEAEAAKCAEGKESVEGAEATEAAEETQQEEVLDKEQQLEEQLAQVNDKYIRLSAEFDNYRRRGAKERIELISTASEEVIKGLLPTLDDCERALEVLSKSEDSQAAKEGIELIMNKLGSYLKSKGLAEIEAKGSELDTDFHEAVAQFPVEDKKQKNKIIDVVQKGYTLNGKVIRFAKVVVGI